REALNRSPRYREPPAPQGPHESFGRLSLAHLRRHVQAPAVPLSRERGPVLGRDARSGRQAAARRARSARTDHHSHATWAAVAATKATIRSEEHTSELQSRENLVCRLLL